jgi:hypothetical protein
MPAGPGARDLTGVIKVVDARHLSGGPAAAGGRGVGVGAGAYPPAGCRGVRGVGKVGGPVVAQVPQRWRGGFGGPGKARTGPREVVGDEDRAVLFQAMADYMPEELLIGGPLWIRAWVVRLVRLVFGVGMTEQGAARKVIAAGRNSPGEPLRS